MARRNAEVEFLPTLRFDMFESLLLLTTEFVIVLMEDIDSRDSDFLCLKVESFNAFAGPEVRAFEPWSGFMGPLSLIVQV